MNDRNIPPEFRAWPALEPEIRSSLEIQVDRALAKRSIAGGMVYFLVIIVIALSTSYYSDHSIILIATGIATLVTGIIRTLASRRLLAETLGSTKSFRRFLSASIYMTAIVWGAFCAATVQLYQRDWTAMFVLLNSAALTAGASTSLAPNFALASRYLILIMTPAIVSSFLIRDSGYTAFAIMTTVYLGFLLAQTRSNWLAFWSVSVAAERERIRGSAERKRGDKERATLVAAIEQAAEEILITDTQGTIQYCNLAFERITGYPRCEVIGQTPRFLKSGQHDPNYYQTVWATILEGRVWSGSFKNRRKDGSEYETEGTIAPIHDETGKLAGFVSAAHDITDRLRLESELRQAQKMESVGRLAGGVAHDFNNLLTVITGYSGLLDLELPPNHPMRVYVKEICRASDLAASLTRQLLAFSRKQYFHLVVLDLNQLIEQMHGMIQSLVGEDIVVETKCTPDLPRVSADPDQMSQIVMNLAANARDAMPNGGRLTIWTARSAAHEVEPGSGGANENTEHALLAVTDTGQGVPEEVKPHLFEPFFTTKELGQGTGLGLSTVYGIVRQSGGWIDVQTERGKGTTFSIFLPAIESLPPVDNGPERLPAKASFRAVETVLVVEDREDVRRIIKTVLESEGFNVLDAAGGPAALSLSGRYNDRIHLLITDLIMPEMTGKQVAEALMPMRPDMKVLYISGYNGDVLKRRGLSEPNISYLPKPFTPQILSARVHEVLGHGQTARHGNE